MLGRGVNNWTARNLEKELIKYDEMALTLKHNVSVKMQSYAKSWSKHSLVEHSTLFMTIAAQFRDQPFSAADQGSNPGALEYERWTLPRSHRSSFELQRAFSYKYWRDYATAEDDTVILLDTRGIFEKNFN